MSDAALFARRLAAGERVDDPVALVVAHPDDETLWAGAAFARLANLTLIHITDGAPLDMADASRLGFATREDYARARGRELDRALRLLGPPAARIACGVPDQQAIGRLGELADRLAGHLADMAAVLTHPYEGGHPDHDAAALAVRIAVERIGARVGRAPALVEFACYHAIDGERRFGRFWPDADCPEQARPLDPADRDRIGRAIAAHATQSSVVGSWRPDAERWRAAPDYDFTAPPPPGDSLYDRFGWAITSARWRELARQEIAQWA